MLSLGKLKTKYMETATITIPESLQKEIDFTNELINDVKLKIPDWKEKAGKIIQETEEVPIIFQHEQELVNVMIVARDAKIASLKSRYTKMQNYKNATIRTALFDAEPQRFAIEKLILLQGRLNGLLSNTRKPERGVIKSR